MFDFDVVTGPTKKLREGKRPVAPLPVRAAAEKRAPAEPTQPAPAEAVGVGEG